MHFAGFVGAVLAPHHTEDAQLGNVWLAPEDLFDARVFFTRQAVLRRDFGRYLDFSECRGHSVSCLEERAYVRLIIGIDAKQATSCVTRLLSQRPPAPRSSNER